MQINCQQTLLSSSSSTENTIATANSNSAAYSTPTTIRSAASTQASYSSSTSYVHSTTRYGEHMSTSASILEGTSIGQNVAFKVANDQKNDKTNVNIAIIGRLIFRKKEGKYHGIMTRLAC